MTPAERLVKFVLSLDYFAGDDPAIPAVWAKGKSRLFLVLGENAGGKSFFRRLINAAAHEKSRTKEVIALSMQGRTGAYMKSLIYGSEGYEATGANTAHTITMAIQTCRSRNEDHFLYWDEPDVGLSEGATLGVGREIAKFVRKLPDHTRAVFVTTHSRALVRDLVCCDPHYIHLGTPVEDAPATLEAWLERKVKPVSPKTIKEQSHARFLRIQSILDAIQSERDFGDR